MRGVSALVALELGALLLTQCAGGELPAPPHPDPYVPAPPVAPASVSAPASALYVAAPTPPAPVDAGPEPLASADPDAATAPALPDAAPASTDVADGGRCASVPPLGPDGRVPPVPPHAPLGQDINIPDDRPVYVLPGNPGDPRVIIYLPGMCGDATAADFFRETVRAHGTLIAVRGDTPCENGRFKWRDDASKIQTRIRTAFKLVNALHGGELQLEQALLFGYSQGAERAEKVAQRYPQQYPRVVLGGPPMKASPVRLARAQRVAILGGELETTENMRLGVDALQTAGIKCRYFTLECAYHGYFGTSAETQLTEVLDWVTAP
jgi:predicted esterase